jgi:NAD+ diphosphatase
MKSTIFDLHLPHAEPSTMVAFAENSLDRRSEYRAEDCIARALQTEGVHAFAFAGGKLVVKHDEKIIDPLFAPYELAGLDPIVDETILLGYLKNGEPRLAVPVRADPDTLHEPLRASDGRTLYRQQMLDDDLLGQFAQASALLTWNGNSRFCGKCGSPTRMEIGGYRRVCNACGHQTFPRTDPVSSCWRSISSVIAACSAVRRIFLRGCIRASPVSSSRGRRSSMPCGVRRWRNPASASAACATTPPSPGRCRTR